MVSSRNEEQGNQDFKARKPQSSKTSNSQRPHEDRNSATKEKDLGSFREFSRNNRRKKINADQDSRATKLPSRSVLEAPGAAIPGTDPTVFVGSANQGQANQRRSRPHRTQFPPKQKTNTQSWLEKTKQLLSEDVSSPSRTLEVLQEMFQNELPNEIKSSGRK